MDKLKWGIIGSGHIANKFADNIKLVSNAELIACSSKDKARAEAFREKHMLEFAYGSYEEMLANPEIQAVYIATTHNFHYENALLCITYGKHILCEKSFAINATQAEEIFEKAAEKHLFVMEAMWTRFLPVTTWVKEQIRAGAIGETTGVKAQFGTVFRYEPESRAFNRNLAGGGLLDVGIYTISFACNIFGNHPVGINGEAKMGRTGVDEEGHIILTYDGGQTADLEYSMLQKFENTATISGSSGRIDLDSAFAPAKAILEKADGTQVIYENKGHNGFEYEIQEATDLILSGKTESPILTGKDTVEILRICDTLRKQWNFKYPEEK